MNKMMYSFVIKLIFGFLISTGVFFCLGHLLREKQNNLGLAAVSALMVYMISIIGVVVILIPKATVTGFNWTPPLVLLVTAVATARLISHIYETTFGRAFLMWSAVMVANAIYILILFRDIFFS